MCDLPTTHRHKYTLRTQVPWYASPSTAWVDWNKSEGFGKDLDCSHKGYRLISGKKLLRGWFLLMNGLILFMSRELGLLHWPPDLGSGTALSQNTQDLGRRIFLFQRVRFESGLGAFDYWWQHDVAPYMSLHNWTFSCHDCTNGQICCAKPFCFLYNMLNICNLMAPHLPLRERSGSVVDCLTRDREAAGSCLTGVTALWSLSMTHSS